MYFFAFCPFSYAIVILLRFCDLPGPLRWNAFACNTYLKRSWRERNGHYAMSHLQVQWKGGKSFSFKSWFYQILKCNKVITPPTKTSTKKNTQNEKHTERTNKNILTDLAQKSSHCEEKGNAFLFSREISVFTFMLFFVHNHC